MWAHYAEEHTGFVLMFDGSHNFFKGNDPFSYWDLQNLNLFNTNTERPCYSN